MTFHVRSGLAAFCLLTVLTANFAAQQTATDGQQNDNVDSPLLRERARERAQERKGGPAAKERIPEPDDPRARMEWQRRDRGIPSIEFKEHVLRLQHQRALL